MGGIRFGRFGGGKGVDEGVLDRQDVIMTWLFLAPYRSGQAICLQPTGTCVSEREGVSPELFVLSCPVLSGPTPLSNIQSASRKKGVCFITIHPPIPFFHSPLLVTGKSRIDSRLSQKN
jgi:hypothetical protein